MGQGFFWQDLQVGQQLRTFRRTVTEADLVAFINATGMLEAIFIEEGYDGGAIPGRPVPGAMTYALIEGFILQSMIEVTAIKPTSRGNRAVVTSRIEVFNQGHQKVMEYTAVRLLAGRG
jgi:acyl dehydratase